MLTAIIENEGNALVMAFPCKRCLMADHLGSIGIRKPAYEIKCIDEEDEPIKARIFGNIEFEKKLASFISPTDTLKKLMCLLLLLSKDECRKSLNEISCDEIYGKLIREYIPHADI